jgi:hypothetical protein
MPTRPNTPAKPGPAKASPAKAKREKITTPAIDYTKLTVSDSTQPITQSRKSVLDSTPFVAWMQDSRANNAVKEVTVPQSAAKQTQHLVRAAASRIGCGVRMSTTEANGKVTVRFQAKDKRKYTPKPKAAQ